MRPTETRAPDPTCGLRPATLIRRAGSTALLWAVLLGTIFSGWEIAFFALIAALGLAALWEYFQMLDRAGRPNHPVFGMFCAALFMAGSFFYFRAFGHDKAYDFEVAVLLLFLVGIFARQMFDRARRIASLEKMIYTLFGLLYIPWMFNFITKLIYVTPPDPDGRITGHYYVLYLVAVTKLSDVGAYLVGSALGRHQIVPHISPRKTWEGALGALAFGLGASCALYTLLPQRLAAFTPAHAAALGILLSATAVIGDLAESVVKRSLDAKDSGTLVPGIGGVLDVIDSLLFTAPLLFFYLRLVLRAH